MVAKRNTIVLHIGSHTPVLKKRFDWKDFLWDKAQFVVVSAFVFVLSYMALNYQAILENVRFQLEKKNFNPAVFEQLDQTKETEKSASAEVLQASLLTSESSEKSSETPVSFARASSLPLPRLDAPVYPPDTRLVIPRINKNIPVVGVQNDNLIARKWEDLEKDIQEALRSGVVHYPGTALPGEIGNAVFTGHSSYYAWDPGRFKDVFGLLHEMKVGDRVFVFHNQKKYVYEVFDIRVVKPTEIDVLAKTNDERLTLITCTPLGTNLKRLIVTAKRIG